MTALKFKIHVVRTCFIIIIKHVIKNIISQSNQKIIIIKINAQNFRIHNMMKILYIKYSKNTHNNNFLTTHKFI